jgi:hypothetical protein
VLNALRRLAHSVRCLAGGHQWQARPGTQAEMDGRYVDIEGCAHCAAWRPAIHLGWDSRW